MTRGLSALLTVLLWLAGAPASAHEIGASQASAALRDGVLQIDVVVDPDTLLSKLEVFAGRPVSHGLSRTDRDDRIRDLANVFLAETGIEIDGAVVQPHFEYRPASAFSDLAQSPSVVRLTAPVPSAADRFAFRYGLALGTYALNVQVGDGAIETQWIVGGATSPPISLSSPASPLTRADVARQYVALGFTHIVPHGLDHILFVLGIFLLSSRWRSIVAQVSTFTLAHSITLALTMYGIVSLPAKVIEPLIALSIVYVAIENLIVGELKPWRLALVFSFGLLHGMGFAGVIRDLGLPRPQFLTALVSFNVGVEAGQLTVIAAAFMAVAYWQRGRPTYRRLVVQPASLAIAMIGLFWTIQRVL
ncbi:MAG: HupE/UreJ family protein [Acidobacteriota bacterium]